MKISPRRNGRFKSELLRHGTGRKNLKIRQEERIVFNIARIAVEEKDAEESEAAT